MIDSTRSLYNLLVKQTLIQLRKQALKFSEDPRSGLLTHTHTHKQTHTDTDTERKRKGEVN